MQTDPLSPVRLLCTGKLPVNHIMVQLTATLKNKDLATKGFQKTIPDTPTKTRSSHAQFQKGQPI